MWGFWQRQRNVRVGRARPEGSPEDFCGFGADAMECAHYHNHRVGDDDEGVWFRLHDGRAFDWTGDRSRFVDSFCDLTL
jgi:hypothetical protein